jgi:hypothetical protein
MHAAFLLLLLLPRTKLLAAASRRHYVSTAGEWATVLLLELLPLL